jgi:hypothetical protein
VGHSVNAYNKPYPVETSGGPTGLGGTKGKSQAISTTAKGGERIASGLIHEPETVSYDVPVEFYFEVSKLTKYNQWINNLSFTMIKARSDRRPQARAVPLPGWIQSLRGVVRLEVPAERAPTRYTELPPAKVEEVRFVDPLAEPPEHAFPLAGHRIRGEFRYVSELVDPVRRALSALPNPKSKQPSPTVERLFGPATTGELALQKVLDPTVVEVFLPRMLQRGPDRKRFGAIVAVDSGPVALRVYRIAEVSVTFGESVQESDPTSDDHIWLGSYDRNEQIRQSTTTKRTTKSTKKSRGFNLRTPVPLPNANVIGNVTATSETSRTNADGSLLWEATTHTRDHGKGLYSVHHAGVTYTVVVEQREYNKAALWAKYGVERFDAFVAMLRGKVGEPVDRMELDAWWFEPGDGAKTTALAIEVTVGNGVRLFVAEPARQALKSEPKLGRGAQPLTQMSRGDLEVIREETKDPEDGETSEDDDAPKITEKATLTKGLDSDGPLPAEPGAMLPPPGDVFWFRAWDDPWGPSGADAHQDNSEVPAGGLHSEWDDPFFDGPGGSHHPIQDEDLEQEGVYDPPPPPREFPNLRPEDFAQERILAKEASAYSFTRYHPDFENLVRGRVIWVVTEKDKLIFPLESFGNFRMRHALLSDGQPVRSAGTAQLWLVDGGWRGLIDNDTGYFETSAKSLAYAKEIFEDALIFVDVDTNKLHP